MLLAPLPFEYIHHLDPGDRRRRTHARRPTGVRVRRVPKTIQD